MRKSTLFTSTLFTSALVFVFMLILALPSMAQQSQLVLTAQAPPPTVSVGANYTGGGNFNTPIFYWVVVRYPSGTASPTGPAIANGTVGSQNLSATQFVTINWAPMPNATGYDVIRSNTSNYPAPCSACAVALNTALTSIADTGGLPSDYPPAGLNNVTAAQGVMTINNLTLATPFIPMNLNGINYNVGLVSPAATVGSLVQFGAGGVLVNGVSSVGVTSINTLVATAQTLTTGTAGTNFGIVSALNTHTFNLPTASAVNRGLLSTGDWTTFNGKLSTAITSMNLLTGTAQAMVTGTAGTDFAITSALNTHTFDIPTASAANRGLLSTGDWTTFNGKLGATSGAVIGLFTGCSGVQYLGADGACHAAGGGGVALSGITAATGINTIDSLNFAQNWDWSTASTQDPWSMNFNALTTGSAMSLLTSNAALASTNGFFRVVNSGAATGTTPFTRIQPNSTAGSGLTITNEGKIGFGVLLPAFLTDMKSGESYGYNGQPMARGTTTLRNWYFGNSANLTATGTDNTSIGDLSLTALAGGVENTASGSLSMRNNTSGSYNTISGFQSFFYNTAGSYNVAMGWNSLIFSLGSNNVAVGAYALRRTAAGDKNVAVGSSSMEYNTTGINNVAVGTNSLFSNDSGSENVSVGDGTLYQSTGSGNTASGFNAMSAISSGANNTAYGYQAGKFIANGIGGNSSATRSVYLGYNSRSSAAAATNEIVIGAIAIGEGSNKTVIGSSATTDTKLFGVTSSNGYISDGTTFTASGCTVGTLVGGATVGTLVSGTAGACTFTITMGSSATATNGWACRIDNLTTPANLMSQTTPVATTQATMTGITALNDVMSFMCMGY